VAQFIAYLPFGETFVEQHTSWESPYKFNAKERDEETGLYHYGARFYDPGTSTWLSVDPLSINTPAWSPYTYTFDNPVMYVDPDGRLPLVHYLSSDEQYLSGVRAHDNKGKAGLGASAYTSGTDVNFSGGGDAGTLGHESAHVVQQSVYRKSASRSRSHEVSGSRSAFETSSDQQSVSYGGFGGNVRKSAGKTTTLLGRFKDTENGYGTGEFILNRPGEFKTGENPGGLNVLNIKNWTWTRTRAWIWDAMIRGDNIRFISDPTSKKNIFRNGTGGEKTVTGQEIELLQNLGYTWDASTYSFIKQ